MSSSLLSPRSPLAAHPAVAAGHGGPAAPWAGRLPGGPAVAGTVLMLGLGALAAWGLPGDLSGPARISLLVLAAALAGWTVLRSDDTAVALLAALVLVLAGVLPVERLHDALGQELIWLMVGGFLLAAVLRGSGLAERWALQAVAGSGSLPGLMRRLTLLIAVTAFLVPSTSGRATLLLPVFLALSQALDRPAATRALALLFPTVILLSAGASLLGAGAHLMALDALRAQGVAVPGFLSWTLLAAPPCLLACGLACGLIERLSLSPDERRQPIALPVVERGPLRREQKAVAAIVGLTVLAWAAGPALGLDPVLVALAGSLAATQPRWTGIRLGEALRGVEWSLILFLAATSLLAEALLDTGAAASLARALIQALPAGAEHLLLGAALLLALLAHLLVVSRSARVVLLLPLLGGPLAAAGFDPLAGTLLLTLASGFCQTLVVSAKPLAVYARVGDRDLFAPGDLAKLSLSLLLPVAALLLLAATFWWPALGLPLRAA